MIIGNLVLEVTRKCNMACAHCLRGDAENIDMSKDIIDRVFDHAEQIDTVTFTGGEPTLNLPLIQYFFEEAERRDIEIGSFFVATNGKENQEGLAVLLMRAYMQVNSPETCGVSLSVDDYHDPQEYDRSVLKALAFYSNCKEQGSNMAIVAEGRAKSWGNRQPEIKGIFWEDHYIGQMYVGANGNICWDCDLSYEHIDEISDCDVWHLDKFLEE